MFEWQYQPFVAPTPNYQAAKHQIMTQNNYDSEDGSGRQPDARRYTTVTMDAFDELSEMDRMERDGGKIADEVASRDIVEETDQHKFCAPVNCHQCDYPDIPDMDPPKSLDAPDIEVPGAEDVGMELEDMSDDAGFLDD